MAKRPRCPYCKKPFTPPEARQAHGRPRILVVAVFRGSSSDPRVKESERSGSDPNASAKLKKCWDARVRVNYFTGTEAP